MTTYVDSSVLVALYVPERHSAAARAEVRRRPRIPFTALHDLEVRNAFELMRGRGQLTVDQVSEVRQQLNDDIAARRLQVVELAWPDVLAIASELSAAHSSRLLTRSLDLLHVAAARAGRCRVFVSADDRQLALARAAKLRVVDVKQA